MLERRFTIRTDQRSLKFLLDSRFKQESQHPWLLKLAGYDYIVEYKRGAENKVADVQSRRLEEEYEGEKLSSKTTTVIEPTWIQDVEEMVNSSQYFKEIQEKAEKGETFQGRYTSL